MKILVTGASGFIGSALVAFLEGGHYKIATLVRRKSTLLPHEIPWDPEKGMIDFSLLEGFHAVVHLAGASIGSIWTRKRKQEILQSRVQGTSLLCHALSQLAHPPSVLISGSAIGYYGNQGDRFLTEHSSKGTGFLSDVCEQWESATQPAIERGIRTIHLRTGVVLSSQGGLLKRILIPFKLGLGGELGGGDQYMSWIALEDLLGVIYYAIRQESLIGALNAVSPNPITNHFFTKSLGKVLHRPTFCQLPAFLLKGLFGEMANELLLSSQRAIPELLEEKGFRFDYPDLDAYFNQIFN